MKSQILKFWILENSKFIFTGLKIASIIIWFAIIFYLLILIINF